MPLLKDGMQSSYRMYALDGKIRRKESEKGNHFAIEGFYRMVHIESNLSQLQIPRTKT